MNGVQDYHAATAVILYACCPAYSALLLRKDSLSNVLFSFSNLRCERACMSSESRGRKQRQKAEAGNRGRKQRGDPGQFK